MLHHQQNNFTLSGMNLLVTSSKRISNSFARSAIPIVVQLKQKASVMAIRSALRQTFADRVGGWRYQDAHAAWRQGDAWGNLKTGATKPTLFPSLALSGRTLRPKKGTPTIIVSKGGSPNAAVLTVKPQEDRMGPPRVSRTA